MPSVTTPPTETRTFAHRVRLNLDAVDAVSAVAPAKAHQITQLVLSFVGLIVLPRETHYLRVHLAAIRRKLEPEPSLPRYLVTEAGLGYRFVPEPE